MPIYEYRRPDGTTFEVQQSFSEEPLTHDPESGAPVTRVFHPPAVHFKGKGFYSTDYGKRGRQREAGAEEAAATNGTGGSSDGDAKSPGSEAGSPKAADTKGDAQGKGRAQDKGSSGGTKKRPASAKG